MAGLVRINLGHKLPKEGAIRQLRAGKRKFCATRTDGEITVTDGLCPHKDLPLKDGRIEGGCLVCPWHGWAFDLKTGKQHKGKSSLRIYPAAVEEGNVLATISEDGPRG